MFDIFEHIFKKIDKNHPIDLVFWGDVGGRVVMGVLLWYLCLFVFVRKWIEVHLK